MIADVLNRYSGMTEEKLEGVTTKLIDIQEKLSELIDYNTILIGHSLECDLRVLKVRPLVLVTIQRLIRFHSSFILGSLTLQ